MNDLKETATIPALADYAANQFGIRPVIVEDGQSLSYIELQKLVDAAAHAFLFLGIERGDRVAIWAPNSCRWIVAAMGAQKAGAILVPLNTRYKGREAGFILRKSKAKALLTEVGFLGIDYPALIKDEDMPDLRSVILLSGRGNGMDWDRFIAAGSTRAQQSLPQLTGQDVSDILFTSGTTGNPKGVMTTHGQNLWVYEQYARRLGLCATDRYLIATPFFVCFGYKAGWLSALMRGATIFPLPLLDIKTLLATIESKRITVLPGPPTLYQMILDSPDRGKYDLSSLRVAITGGSVVPKILIQQMHDILGFETVLTAYGLTETCGVATMCVETDSIEMVATTAGRALDGVEIKVVDENGVAVSPGLAGEILVRGHNVMLGYYEDAEETSRIIDAEGWLCTGDIGVLDEHGYIRITDRKKDMFIAGGLNCYPAEIENVLSSHPDILQVAVVGIPDARLGEVGKAYVVAKTGSFLSAEGIITWARENMANYKVPREVEICASLPINASGKIQKFLLKKD